jgi:CDP-glucose 4,6-dehydratase
VGDEEYDLIDRAFWHGKRVLLTGHTGFKGAWMSALLDGLGASVAGLSLPPDSDAALWPAIAPHVHVREYLVDLRDSAAVARIVNEERPEVVIHMAAQALVRRSYKDPAATYATNVLGTVHLLQALASRQDVCAILVVTSDKVYENTETRRAFVEEDRLGGGDPYSASKAACELVVKSYACSFFSSRGVPIATARAGNVIGGGDWAEDRLIPDIVRARMTGEIVRLRHPGARRPWQHVLDCVTGYLGYVEYLSRQSVADPSALNFGPARSDLPLTVAELAAEFLVRLAPQGAARSLDMDMDMDMDADSLPEKNCLVLSAEKARHVLGWTPRMEIKTAIAWTADWYASLLDGADAHTLVTDQIERYSKLTSCPP